MWGLWQGTFCALEGVGVIRTDGLKKSAGGRLVLRVYTALVLLMGNVLFRAGSIAEAWRIVRAMAASWHFTALGTLSLQTLCTPLAAAMLVLGLALSLFPGLWSRRRDKRWAEPAGYVLSLALLALCVMRMAQSGFAPFIYLQF